MEALKGNQKLLHEAVENYFELAEKENFRERKYTHFRQVEAGHHRIEKREVWTIPVSSLPGLPKQELWTGLSTIVMLKSERKLGNKTTQEVRFYVSSLPNNAEIIAKAIRSHIKSG